MFDLCKKVNVYNIENHYHYHYESSKTHQQHNIHFKNLKPLPIQVTSSNKKTTLDSQRRGIQLSKTLHHSKQIKSHRQQTRKKLNIDMFSSQQYQNHLLSSYKQDLLISTQESQLSKAKALSSNMKQTIDLVESQNRQIIRLDSGRNTSCQSMKRKNKPITTKNIRNSQTLTFGHIKYGQTSSSGINCDIQSKRQQIQKHNQSISIKNRTQHKQSKDFSSEISFFLEDRMNISTNSYRDESSFHNLSTSKNYQNINKIHQNPQNIYKIFVTPDQNQKVGDKQQNNSKFKKLLTTPNSTSVLLSSILSRADSSKIQSTYQPYLQSDKKHKGYKQLKDLDRITLKSFQADFSEFSVHIQESVLCEHNPLNYFLQIRKQSFQKYSLYTAIQKNVGFAVTLKEINFDYMLDIAQQLKVYSVIQEQLKNNDDLCLILDLLQVQVTTSCYMLMKQPYQQTLRKYLKKYINRQNCLMIVQTIKKQVMELISKILNIFSQCHFYPLKLFSIDDFVTSLGIVKLQNLQIFQHIDAIPNDVHIFTIKQISQGIQNQINKLYKQFSE